VDGAAEALDRVDEVAGAAVADLLSLPGVRRVGLALTEGGGRRLRFTASDRDHSRSVDWCHIDAYDDVPLTAVVRTGQPVVSALEDLHGRYAGFVRHQRTQGTAALAAVPLPGSGASPIGGLILFYAARQPFDDTQWSRLDEAAADLASALRAAQAVTPRDGPALAEEPVPPDSRVADLVVDGEPQSVGTARRWARRCLDEWGVEDDVVEGAALCLSELVTNAVIHTRSSCEVRLLLDDGALTVTVRDQGRDQGRAGGSWADQKPDDPLRVHGRGLQLVDAVASRWGSTLDASGTTVWFTLDATSGDGAGWDDAASSRAG
jgi:anti-sigma regulatory factor (Ser/Thr protein kinase)